MEFNVTQVHIESEEEVEQYFKSFCVFCVCVHLGKGEF